MLLGLSAELDSSDIMRRKLSGLVARSKEALRVCKDPRPFSCMLPLDRDHPVPFLFLVSLQENMDKVRDSLKSILLSGCDTSGLCLWQAQLRAMRAHLESLELEYGKRQSQAAADELLRIEAEQQDRRKQEKEATEKRKREQQLAKQARAKAKPPHLQQPDNEKEPERPQKGLTDLGSLPMHIATTPTPAQTAGGASNAPRLDLSDSESEPGEEVSPLPLQQEERRPLPEQSGSAASALPSAGGNAHLELGSESDPEALDNSPPLWLPELQLKDEPLGDSRHVQQQTKRREGEEEAAEVEKEQQMPRPEEDEDMDEEPEPTGTSTGSSRRRNRRSKAKRPPLDEWGSDRSAINRQQGKPRDPWL